MGVKRGRLRADAPIYCGNRAVEKDISIARLPDSSEEMSDSDSLVGRA